MDSPGAGCRFYRGARPGRVYMVRDLVRQRRAEQTGGSLITSSWGRARRTTKLQGLAWINASYLNSCSTRCWPFARRAGGAILEVYNAADELQIQSKTDDSPLTIADDVPTRLSSTAPGTCCRIFLSSLKNPRSEGMKSVLVGHVLVGRSTMAQRNSSNVTGEFTVNIALIPKPLCRCWA